MPELAKKENCTACGACAYKCPKACISMEEDQYGLIYPKIRTDNCINCHICENACPIIQDLSFRNPIKAFAAWSNDKEERRTSASGGIAAEIYKMALEDGYFIVGASQNLDFSVTHKVISTTNDLFQLKNSKYVFSHAYDIYPQIKDLLQQKKKIVFIGLPCQVAALRTIFKDDDNLILIDLVCHGTTPVNYLVKHIDYLEKEIQQKVSSISFRDPDFCTSNYYFSLFNNNNQRIYSKQTKNGELFNFGYHRSITYRENCYQCPFAKSHRLSDLTLSDYKGLGKKSPSSYSSKKVSCVLVNSPKGENILRKLNRLDKIFLEERPIDEPINGDRQLRMPSTKSKYRIQFETMLNEKGEYSEDIILEIYSNYCKDESKLNSKILKLLKKIYKSLESKF